MSKVNRYSLEERYGYQNRKVIYDKDADDDIELNNIYTIIELLNKTNEQIAELKKQLHTQPREIVKKIKSRMDNVVDTLINLGNGKEDAVAWFCGILEEILKEYGGEE